MLVAHDGTGQVVATLDYCVALVDGQPVGHVDFGAHEDAGGQLTDIWHVSNAVRSGVAEPEPAHSSSTPEHLPVR